MHVFLKKRLIAISAIACLTAAVDALPQRAMLCLIGSLVYLYWESLGALLSPIFRKAPETRGQPKGPQAVIDMWESLED